MISCNNIMKHLLIFLFIVPGFFCAQAEDDAEYVKANAVRIDNPEKLTDSVYALLNPFQLILFGEMHGTNESTPFVNGLVDLFLSKGDSIQVGFEIPSSKMASFISLHSDSSIYHSDFFGKEPQVTGKETIAWANLISRLNRNKRVQIFFFEMNEGEAKLYLRDSIMSTKVRMQFDKHPTWRMITLSGNYH